MCGFSPIISVGLLLGLLLSILPISGMHLYKKLAQIAVMLAPLSFLGRYYISSVPVQEEQEPQISSLAQRPERVQKKIDYIFEGIKNNTYWGLYNGSEWYEPIGIDEEILVRKLVALGKKDIYLMDVGCGKGDWGRNIKNILETNHKNSKTRFHIFSITGGQECPEETIQKGNITLHQLNQFKIENIDEELIKRGFNLKNKTDFIVSHWALRHMVDPIGTVDRLYGLLNPAGGKMSSNGFFFKLDTSEMRINFPNDYPHILTNSNASTLFREYNLTRSMDQFLLERNNKKSLDLPLKYTGTIEGISSYRFQCNGETVTEFQLTKPIGDTPLIEELGKKKSCYNRDHYCVKNDKQCKALYARLKKQGFFNTPKTEKKRIQKNSEHWFIAQ